LELGIHGQKIEEAKPEEEEEEKDERRRSSVSSKRPTKIIIPSRMGS